MIEEPEIPVLLADADINSRAGLRAMLQNSSLRLTEVETGDAALENLRDSDPSVVLLDLDLPGISGEELLQEIPKGRHEIIVLTALSDSGTIIRCYGEGAADFLIKPVTERDMLLKAVDRAAYRILNRETIHRRTMKLRAQADWQYWKGLFLSGDAGGDSIKALDQMHVRFNQDVNYPHLLTILGDHSPKGDEDVTIPADLYRHMIDSLQPLATFSEGVSLATRLIHREPSTAQYAPEEFVGALKGRIEHYKSEILPIRDQKLSANLLPFKHEGERHLNLDLYLVLEAIDEIVTNACKYSDDGNDILLVLEPRANDVAITVSNPAVATTRLPNGEIECGVPRELEEVVFRFFLRFSKFQDSRYNERWPMGLGLPLIRRTFEAHGGTATLHNENWYVGEVATTRVSFIGTLPLHEGAATPAEGVTADSGADDNIELF